MTAIQIYKLDKTSTQDNGADNILAQLAQIESKLFVYDAWSAAQINSLLAQPFNHIIYATDELNTRLVGYCFYSHIFEDSEILRIATCLDYQQQGIASQLLTAMAKMCQVAGAERVLLEVREDNHAAIAFYQKHGFEQIAVRKNYYDNHDTTKTHALIMQRRLNDKLNTK
ncbi:ribosomal-protein-alanine N-acetyltransferase [Moraxella osloensis]|uniref:Ribosomal-protein-alanine N-acetyltransferase n=1 Tax=Faucicola osloensis TaxID=34062 RepID=A0AAW6TGB9_FAUOS|nr:ribosomal protein S18-alanine N-acetyltransferase [Moraxella osloensis]MDI4510608.1 ribosomal-protein-alanine N-acetyltransferase [Moraxella osloensis]